MSERRAEPQPEARTLTRGEVLEVLTNEDLDGLLGTAENETLDFKGSPYDLSQDWQKSELAKDVSALANRSGGVIVIGYATQRAADSPLERATAVRAVPRERINEQQYRDVIRSGVYPSLGGLQVTFVPKPDDPDKGVLFIDVPPQEQAARPFLVVEPMQGETRARGWLFGVATRSFDETETQRVGEIHALISQGMGLAPRLEAIEAALGRLAPEATAEAPPAETIPGADEAAAPEPERVEGKQSREARSNAFASARLIAHVRSRLGVLPEAVQELPVLYLAATPVVPARVPTIFRTEGVRGVLENPPHSRHDGWNLVTADRARIEGGELLAAANGDRKHLALFENGSFVAIGSFYNFLSRGDSRRFDKINPLALVEFTHDFVLTYSHLLEFIEPRPTSGVVQAGVRRGRWGEKDGEALFLPPHGIGSAAWTFGDPEDYPPIDRPGWDSLPLVTDLREPVEVGKIALALLERIYAAFGRVFEQIPYVNDDRTAVDAEAFTRR